MNALYVKAIEMGLSWLSKRLDKHEAKEAAKRTFQVKDIYIEVNGVWRKAKFSGLRWTEVK